MINLEKLSGLPIELKDDYSLRFNAPLADREPTFIRKSSEMVPVLMDKDAVPSADDVYFVYRGLCLPQHEQIIKDNHLTYDVTILPPLMLGREFNKTVGHYHDNIPGTDIAHPEIYEVISGRALVVWQKMNADFTKVEDFITIEAKTGDKLIYPPNYGHILINIGKEALVMANWLSTDYKPLYEPVALKRGMAYYVVSEENGGFRLIKNPEYGEVPQARSISIAAMKHFAITADKPIYQTGMENTETLRLLGKPGEYTADFAKILA